MANRSGLTAESAPALHAGGDWVCRSKGLHDLAPGRHPTAGNQPRHLTMNFVSRKEASKSRTTRCRLGRIHARVPLVPLQDHPE
jgi:hypothetical protein